MPTDSNRGSLKQGPASRWRTSLRFSNATSSPLGQVTVTGFAVPQDVAMTGPRVFGQYALVYVLDGEGVYEDANGWKQSVGPGDLMLVFPELAHTYNPRPGTQWITTFLCFAGPVFDLWRQSGLLDARRPVHHLQPLDVWSRRIEAVLGGTRQAGFAPPLVEVCRLQELLAAIATGEGRAETYREDQLWAQRACSLIEAQLLGSGNGSGGSGSAASAGTSVSASPSPDWAKIAALFGLTAEGFRKRFTRITGQSPARYQTGRRIDRACVLMQQSTRMTDRQIAELLGFCDEFYFSRRFKEITGQSPRAFRLGNRFGDKGLLLE